MQWIGNKKKHPFVDYSGTHRVLQKKVRSLKKLDPQAMMAKFKASPKDTYFRVQPFFDALPAAIGLHQMTGKKEDKELAIRLAKAMLEDKLQTPIKTLCAKIDQNGVKNPDHFIMRDACYDFAALYYLTKDKKYARKAEAILSRFADVIKKMAHLRPPLY